MLEGDKKGPEIESVIREDSLRITFTWNEMCVQLTIDQKGEMLVHTRKVERTPYEHEIVLFKGG